MTETDERPPGRTTGKNPGDEFHDGHRLRSYPLSGRSGFIEAHTTMCDACAESSGKNPQYASQHWARPTDNCEHPDHDSNVILHGVDQPNEYEHFKDHPDVRGWAKDNFTTNGADTTLCTSCAEDHRASGKPMDDFYAIPKTQLMPKDSCDNCGHLLENGRKEASLDLRDFQPVTAAVNPDFLKDAGVHHIVNKWHEATDDEKSQGKRWYSDAHLVSKAIAHGDAAKGAGIVAVYSPQTPWPQNLFNAARVLHEGRGLGGPGSGFMATGSQRDAADKILKGGHYEDVLKGHKVRAFASLIHHAGQDPHDPGKPSPHVCVDRHALSVVMGRRLSDDEFSSAGLSTKTRYHSVCDHYHAAAHVISAHEGEPVAGHQVQAVTWITQQRQNQAEDEARAHTDQLSKGRGTGFANAVDRWKGHQMEHHPELSGKAPTAYASRRAAARLQRHGFGETKAPEAVDTLRDDICPICGESDSYDGDTCGNCGFVTPPSIFQDPDLSKAKQLDLRGEQGNDAPGQFGVIDPNGDENGLPPVDPEMVDDEGGVPTGDVEDQDPEATDDDAEEDEARVEGEVRGLESGEPEQEVVDDAVEDDAAAGDDEEPADPDEVDDEGNVGGPEDPNAADTHVNQGGEPFTKGPNAPTPEEPMEPGQDNPAAEEGAAEAEVGEGGAGYAGDGVADLFCPSCGFGADSAHPTTTPSDPAVPANAGDGMVEGDICPNCTKATLMSGAAPVA